LMALEIMGSTSGSGLASTVGLTSLWGLQKAALQIGRCRREFRAAGRWRHQEAGNRSI